MEKLKEFKEELNNIKTLTNVTDERKNMLLATLMTRMEQHYKIPALNDEKFNANNKKVITLYRKISYTRKF